MLRFTFSASANARHPNDMEQRQAVHRKRTKRGSVACAPASPMLLNLRLMWVMLSFIFNASASTWQVHDMATKNEAPLQTHLDLGIPDVLALKIDLLLGPVGLQLLHEFLAKVPTRQRALKHCHCFVQLKVSRDMLGHQYVSY